MASAACSWPMTGMLRSSQPTWPASTGGMACSRTPVASWPFTTWPTKAWSLPTPLPAWASLMTGELMRFFSQLWPRVLELTVEPTKAITHAVFAYIPHRAVAAYLSHAWHVACIAACTPIVYPRKRKIPRGQLALCCCERPCDWSRMSVESDCKRKGSSPIVCGGKGHD